MWEAWASESSSLSRYPISRRYTDSSSPVVEQQPHVFSDASSKGFGGVVYLRQFHKDTTISISLVTAKTRIAPLKNSLTIPKLEQSAALLTARLLKVVVTFTFRQISGIVGAIAPSRSAGYNIPLSTGRYSCLTE